MDLYAQLMETKAYLQSKLALKPRVAAVLGSGLGFVAKRLTEVTEVPYEDIPHFKVSAVPGHAGKLVVGKLGEVPVMVFCGRVHLYEGYSAVGVSYPVRAAVALGAEVVILTNAAGTVWPHWSAGDIMIMKDHINFQGTNALIGLDDDRLGERFLDMTDIYDAALRGVLKSFAMARGIDLREGVYCAFLGSSYETKAEVRMARTLGGDALGMSTVQEAITARQGGARVLGLSIITNLGSGVSGTPLSHGEVKEAANKVGGKFIDLLTGVIPELLD